MMLSDRTIAVLIESREVEISPRPKLDQLQPVSVDLVLGNSFCRLPRNQFDEHRKVITDRYHLNPGGFLLACTHERIKLPSHIAASVHGKSTMARQGLMVEAAGLVDPGFEGHITLELKNLSHLPIPLTAGMRICQISFYAIDLVVMRPYGSPGLNSHYQHQAGAEPAR